MDSLFLLALVALTSALAYRVGRRWGLEAAGLRAAAGRMAECLGLWVLFFAANVGAGFLAVLALRRLTGAFVSLYANTDVSIMFLSFLQAVLFQWWRAGRR